MRTSTNFLTAGLIVASLAAGSAACAATSTGTLPVSALVLRSCSVVALPLAFGNYDPTTTTPNDASTTLTVLCTTGTSFQVGLDSGQGTGATVAARKMTGGGSTLSYALFQDTARNTLWGNTPGTDTPAATTAGVLPSLVTVYGRVPASQNVPMGLYNDSVTITLTY